MTTTTITLNPGDTLIINAPGSEPIPPIPPEPNPIPPGITVIDIDWSVAYMRYYTSSYGGFHPDSVFALCIKPTTTSSKKMVRIAGAEYQGSPWPRTWCLSAVAGQFEPQPSPMSYLACPGSPSFTCYFSVATVENLTSMYPVLQVGKTYYLNLKNCGTSDTDNNMFIDVAK